MSEVVNYHETVWNEGILKALILEEELGEIIKIFISQNNQDDIIIWHYDKKGQYKIKFEYYVEVSKE